LLKEQQEVQYSTALYISCFLISSALMFVSGQDSFSPK
jgi:hypothetical protein